MLPFESSGFFKGKLILLCCCQFAQMSGAHRTPYANYAIIAVNIIVFLLTYWPDERAREILRPWAEQLVLYAGSPVSLAVHNIRLSAQRSSAHFRQYVLYSTTASNRTCTSTTCPPAARPPRRKARAPPPRPPPPAAAPARSPAWRAQKSARNRPSAVSRARTTSEGRGWAAGRVPVRTLHFPRSGSWGSCSLQRATRREFLIAMKLVRPTRSGPNAKKSTLQSPQRMVFLPGALLRSGNLSPRVFIGSEWPQRVGVILAGVLLSSRSYLRSWRLCKANGGGSAPLRWWLLLCCKSDGPVSMYGRQPWRKNLPPPR